MFGFRRIKKNERVVPECDYQLLKFIITNSASGHSVVIDPAPNNQAVYTLSKRLLDYYDEDSMDILQKTGAWVC